MYNNIGTQAYDKSAAFVPRLAGTVVKYLDAKPTDQILDIGCGDGKFTAGYLSQAGYVLGLDASPSMIKTAKQNYGSAKAEFLIVDCRHLRQEADVVTGTWDKV
jgi:ubiquinone/menaquinone biosynthesis C-methylase UbiE